MLTAKFWAVIIAASIFFTPATEGATKKKKEFKEKKPKTEQSQLPKLSIPNAPFAFDAPKGWQCIEDRSQLPAKVALVYLGRSKGPFTPSINLATEPTTLPLSDYLKMAKTYHESQGSTTCHSLGTVQTQAGPAELLQIDRATQWGQIRFLQAALIKDGTAYVITATCLKDEFTQLYSQFLHAMETFVVN